MHEPNSRLRAARERLPSVHVPGECLSRRELAEAVNAWLHTTTGRVHELDAHYIAKLERGVVRWPNAGYRSAFRHVLRAGSDQTLGFRPTRRGSSVAATVPAAFAPPTGTVTATATVRAMTHALHLADRRVGGGGLYETAVRYLTLELAPRLVDSNSPDGAELFAAAGSLSEIAAWMAHDAGQDDRARQHLDRAYRFATAAGHPSLTGSVCASLSHLAGQLGQPTDAARIATAGLHHARDDNGHLTARLHAMNARAHAMRGDGKSCTSALDHSERALRTATDEHPAEWTAPFDEGSLSAEAALCLRQLGQLDAAEHHARRAVSLRNGDRIRGRAFSQVTLARVLVDANRPEEAAAVGRQVCAVAPHLTSHRVRTRLDRLAAALIPHQDQPEASTFLAEVRALRHANPDHAADGASWPV